MIISSKQLITQIQFKLMVINSLVERYFLVPSLVSGLGLKMRHLTQALFTDSTLKTLDSLVVLFSV